MFNIIKIVVIVFTTFLYGCASTPTPEKMQAAIAGY